MNKIVHIMLAGPVTDGWDYQDNILTKYHRRLGYEVTIITSQWVWNDSGSLKKYERTNYFNSDGVKVIRLPIVGKDDFSRKWKRFKNFQKCLENENPNILFIHNVSFADVNIVCRFLKDKKNIKVFVDNHSDFSNSGTNWISKNILHKVIWKRRAKMLNPYVRKFYGVLPARVDWLVDLYGLPKEKCELLVMGADNDKIIQVEQSDIKNKIRNRHNVKCDDFLIVTGGKIDIWKKQTILLMQAIHNIPHENIKLIVFGPVVPELKEQVEKLSDGNRVQYIGSINSEDSYAYFLAADLVVFPGRHSVFWEQVVGMGIPMVCKYWDGTTHVDIGGNVKFLKLDTVEEIQDTIEEIIENEDVYNQMKVAAQGAGKANFLYQEIAARAIQ